MEQGILHETNNILRTVYNFSKYQIENKEVLVRMKYNLQNRLPEKPFAIDNTRFKDILINQFSVVNKSQKRLVKQFLMYL